MEGQVFRGILKETKQSSCSACQKKLLLQMEIMALQCWRLTAVGDFATVQILLGITEMEGYLLESN